MAADALSAAGVPSCPESSSGGEKAAPSADVVPVATSMLQPSHMPGEAAAGSASGPCVCTRTSKCVKPAGHMGFCGVPMVGRRKGPELLQAFHDAGEVSAGQEPGTASVCARTRKCTKAGGHMGFCAGHPLFKRSEGGGVRTKGALLALCIFQFP
jgi:hypothetical protein